MCVCQILGCDTAISGRHDSDPVGIYHNLICDQIAGVRRLPGMADALIVLSLECNLGSESHHILQMLRRKNLQNYVAMSEGPGSSLGFLTTHSRKVCVTRHTRTARAALS